MSSCITDSLGQYPQSRSAPIEIRPANEDDNEGLLALTRAAPMAGTISIRIDREPDFFALLRLRGNGKVFAAVRAGEIVGCFSAAIRTVYVSGIPESVAYVGDMKVNPRFAGNRIASRLIYELEDYLRSIKNDLCFSVVAKGNNRAMPLFKDRRGVQWTNMGRFLVDELVPSPIMPRSKGCSIQPAESADLPEITRLLDGVYRSRQFAPRLSEEEVERSFSNSGENPFFGIFVARTKERIVATLTLQDMREAKRNVLIGAPVVLRGALGLLRIVSAAVPNFCVPRIGEPLRLLCVRHIACEDGHLAALKCLLEIARVEAFRRRFTFLVIGLHERDPLRAVVHGIPRFTFSSLGLATGLITPERLEWLSRGIAFEDFALV
jgi:hypothetical protein